MKNQTFHIIGGGIAGLASALAVAHSNNCAVVMEKAERFEAMGAGLQLGPNAVRALQKLDCWDAVESTTSSPPEIHIRDGRSGQFLTRLKLGADFARRHGTSYRVAHRADLLNALLQVAKSSRLIEIQTGHEITELSNYANIIAADGIWSKTRLNLFPNSPAIIGEHIYHRALVPLAETPANDCVNLWLFPHGHVVHYPVGSPAKLNLVAVTKGHDVQTHFAQVCVELRNILECAKSWTTWPSAYVPKLSQWSKGNCTLIGDAAHGTMPYLAQGAAMALEDAADLGMRLKSSTNNIIQIFEDFSKARSSRTWRLHQATVQTGKIYHLSGLAASLRNAAMKAAPAALMASRLDWIYCDV